MTSAGASIKQDAISANPEAAEWTKGCGSGVALPMTLFALSYVEKNRPAAIYMSRADHCICRCMTYLLEE